MTWLIRRPDSATSESAAAGAAYRAANYDYFPETPQSLYTPSEQAALERMNEAIGELRELKPLLKPQLIKACATTVMHDGELNGDEFELMQGVEAALDCPLPPTIYSQP